MQQTDDDPVVRRVSVAIWVMVVFAVASAAFITSYAVGSHGTTVNYYTNCINHGFVHGSSQTDFSWHSRIETGCNSNWRKCEAWDVTAGAPGSYMIGYGLQVSTSGTCNFEVYPSAQVGDDDGAAFVEAGSQCVCGNVFSFHGHPANL